MTDRRTRGEGLGLPMCQLKPAWLRLWPGEPPDLVCDDHADDCRKIAEALGCEIPLVALVTFQTDAVCACTEGHVQEIHMT